MRLQCDGCLRYAAGQFTKTEPLVLAGFVPCRDRNVVVATVQ